MFVIADTYSCFCNNNTVSMLKAENVVKPPRMPVMMNMLTGLLISFNAAMPYIDPIIEHPIKFTATVPKGSIYDAVLRSACIMARNVPPIPAPKNIKI